MKRIFVATLAMATLFACNKDIANENSSIEDKVWVEFTAGIDTKASLVEGDKVTPHTITWEVEDLIAVNGETLKASEAGPKTTFTGEVGPAFLDATSYKAIYPRAAGTSFNAVTVEHEQDAVANGFDDIVAVAYSTTRSLNFKHVTSLIRFQVPSDFANITEVSFTADEALAGVVTVTHDSADGNPAVEVTTAENTVTLKGTFEDETDYYVAVLPGAKTNLVVRINGYLSKTYPTATIPTSGVGNMGELPAPVASTDWAVRGEHTGSDWNPVYMFKDNAEGTRLLLKKQKIKTNGFKIANGDWSKQVGASNGWTNNTPDENVNVSINVWNKSYINYNNHKDHICVADMSLTYDIYLFLTGEDEAYYCILAPNNTLPDMLTTDYSNCIMEIVGAGVNEQNGSYTETIWNWGNGLKASNDGKPSSKFSFYSWTWENVSLNANGWKLRTFNNAVSGGISAFDLGKENIDTDNSTGLNLKNDTSDIFVNSGTYDITLTIDYNNNKVIKIKQL